MSEVVALLLDDAMPPERLGALLRSARKRRGMTRKQAAAAAGTTPGKLRRYERGDKTVPAGVCAQLAECYGNDLTAHVPLRMPLQLAGRHLQIGDTRHPVGSQPQDVLAGYVDIVHRLRDSEPGDPLALRSADIVALAGALGVDRDEIEARIADVLGCTRAEARRLHGELLRRKVILPVAGLAAGMAAFAGVAYASHSPSPSPSVAVHAQPIAATQPSTTSSTVAELVPTPPAPAPTTTVAPVETTPTTVAPAPAVPASTPTTVEQDHAETTVTPAPPAPPAPETPVKAALPQPDPADPPVSVLPGETPIRIIGPSDTP
ncbi:MAG: Helix-turn-helix domain [Actinomycetia bacterium]|nr:Helix-turn-helix domain [Actinomycetes bacterium]